MYRLIRPLLFCLNAEIAHNLTLSALRFVPDCFFTKPKKNPFQVMGLTFDHPVGLAAGLDKSGKYLDALAKLGFSFIELGTVTPRPQEGNPKPRLFRLPKARALINRMGFNNPGVDALIENIQRADYSGVLGINIGKNKDTPLLNAVEDYLYCLRRVYPYASYVTINISSPNTPDLRKLQQPEFFGELLNELREEQLQLSEVHQRYVPLVVKVSPDEDDDSLKRIADVILSLGIDGIIATNTTSSHDEVNDLPHGHEQGGVSGVPLNHRSTRCLKVLKDVVGDEVALIGVGGIDNLYTAHQKCNAGASLIQIYTGLIYQGPRLIKSLANGLMDAGNRLTAE